MITVYISGCASCAKGQKELNQLQRFCWQNNITIKIINSKYNSEGRSKHLEALKSINLSTDSYKTVIVTETGYTELIDRIDYSQI